ncbi:hypothetical protein CA54_60560 [Symmachiella macrocystis]|uniref:DUF2924 domain-containing protein n=1 Tax=Symmachiella macrocystis TaxID=2527985 RepID=A0A5C6B184_9PLAN|nr:hypothetical protein CA54_60560 [Symmachiella macrocystis]
MALNIEQEVTALRRMTPRELRVRYEEVFGEECRSNHKQWLIKRIAWRMQANEEGDLSERTRRRAMELANDADLWLKPPQGHDLAKPPARTGQLPNRHDPRLLLPGTTLSRI